MLDLQLLCTLIVINDFASIVKLLWKVKRFAFIYLALGHMVTSLVVLSNDSILSLVINVGLFFIIVFGCSLRNHLLVVHMVPVCP